MDWAFFLYRHRKSNRCISFSYGNLYCDRNFACWLYGHGVSSDYCYKHTYGKCFWNNDCLFW
jgi:hypothetical protein